MKDNITIEREWAMPNRYTFEVKPIGNFVDESVGMSSGLWIDPFAAKADIADITNDLNPEYDTDYTVKALDFFKEFDNNEVDGGVIFDPPYSPTQLKRSYDDIGISPSQYETGSGWKAELKDEIQRVCDDDSYSLSFGWSSGGIGKGRNFEKKKILLVCHGGSHSDTICVREVKKSK